MIQDSLKQCETGPARASPAEYAARLRAVLMDTPTKTLKTLSDANITICLDQRLSKQVRGVWDKRIDGVFYNQKQNGIVSLWDNGKASDESEFLELDAYTHGSQGLKKLADIINDDAVSLQADFIMYAARYTRGKVHVTKWRDALDFDQDSIGKNPILQMPPVRGGALKPNA